MHVFTRTCDLLNKLQIFDYVNSIFLDKCFHLKKTKNRKAIKQRSKARAEYKTGPKPFLLNLTLTENSYRDLEPRNS